MNTLRVHLFSREAATLALLTPERPSAGTLPVTLTRSEEVAALVDRGFTNPQIASNLFISEHTVTTHTARSISKLRLSSRMQVAAWIAGKLPQWLEARS
jgi:DNA-binding NarL/FixJ family response regulator